MNFFVRAILLVTAAALILPESGVASIIFQPGKKAKFVAPGDEEISETALESYQIGQSAEKQGNVKRAIHAYKDIVRRNCRNSCMIISQRPTRIASWSKDILPARTSMRQSRHSFVSAKFIWPGRS
jgi:hypothetical protein